MRTLPFLLCLLCTTLHAEPKAKSKPKPNPGNHDAMWVGEAPADPLPPGVTHHTFQSTALGGREVGYCIYLPPAYVTSPDQRFPVIYNLHGANGDEYRTVYNAQFLHDGIVEGLWPDMIMVFPNGGKSTMYQNSADGKFPAETITIDELIPHIDTTYRTLADRSARCIEGFSMGGRGSTYLAIKHTDLFCSLYNQAGNVYSTTEKAATNTPDEWPVSYLGSDPAYLAAHDVFALIREKAGTLRKELRIQIICGTTDSGHLPSVRDFHQALLDSKIDHTYIEIEGVAHSQKTLIELNRPIWFNYHIESMRRAGGLPKAE